jgi:GR25 family glycosyltransferase involved in LPS biosynthesis
MFNDLEAPSALILTFNRPNSLAKSIKALEMAGVRNIFVSVDGPRVNNQDDYANQIEIFKILEQFRPNFDSLIINKLSKNLGCREGVISGIDWFFKQNDQGIIVEDDIIVNEEFIKFSSVTLTCYKNDLDIWHINGWNMNRHEVVEKPYLSIYPNVWGWATWRDRWEKLDRSKILVNSSNFIDWPTLQNAELPTGFNNYWSSAFYLISTGFDSWDYSWLYTIWSHGGYALTPTVRLTSNIGFNQFATHTKNHDKHLSGYGRRIPQHFPETPKRYLRENEILDRLLEVFVYKIDYSIEDRSKLLRLISNDGELRIRNYHMKLKADLFKVKVAASLKISQPKKTLLRIFPFLVGIRKRLRTGNLYFQCKVKLRHYLKRTLLRIFPFLVGIRKRLRTGNLYFQCKVKLRHYLKRTLLRIFPFLVGIRKRLRTGNLYFQCKVKLRHYLKRTLLRIFPFLVGIRKRLRTGNLYFQCKVKLKHYLKMFTGKV